MPKMLMKIVFHEVLFVLLPYRPKPSQVILHHQKFVRSQMWQVRSKFQQPYLVCSWSHYTRNVV